MEIAKIMAASDLPDVTRRMIEFAGAMETNEIPYAIVGGNAVRAWLGTVRSAPVLTTRDVDVMLRAEDVRRAGAATGRTSRTVYGVDVLIRPDESPREAIHVITGEPGGIDIGGIQFATIAQLADMKLRAGRRKDENHLFAMLEAGLIQPDTPTSYPDRFRRIVEIWHREF